MFQVLSSEKNFIDIDQQKKSHKRDTYLKTLYITRILNIREKKKQEKVFYFVTSAILVSERLVKVPLLQSI